MDRSRDGVESGLGFNHRNHRNQRHKLEQHRALSTATCFAAGTADFIPNTEGVIVAITDASPPWSVTFFSYSNAFPGVACAGSNCWATGYSSSGPVVVTSDASDDWTAETVPTAPVALLALACPTATECLAVGGSSVAGSAAETTNGGGTWNTENVPTGTQSLVGITCPTERKCYAVSTGNGPIGGMLLSN